MRALVALLLLTGCSPFKTFKVDPELAPYVADFDAHYKARAAMSIEFGLLPPTELGACIKIKGGQSYIRINFGTWNKLCEQQRMAVIWHEFGHCALNRPHTLNINSYMYPTIQDCTFYEINEDLLKQEMFN